MLKTAYQSRSTDVISRKYGRGTVWSVTEGKLFVRQKSQTACPRYRLCAIPDVQLAKDIGNVPLYGTQGNEQPLSDFCIGKPFGYQAKYIHLAVTECFDQASVLFPF